MHRVAVLGAGTMGGVHVDCYMHSGQAEVAYVADPRFELAQYVAATCGATPLADPEAALRDPGVEIVSVCLPTYLHRDWVEKAAAMGKHVFCEKPIALSCEDGRAIIEACQKARVRLGIGHVVRYFPEYEMVHDDIAGGRLGRIGVVRLFRGGPFPVAWSNWYSDQRRSGGLLMDLSIHDFDFLQWCLGPVERVYAHRFRNELPLEHTLTVLRMKSGAIAHVEGSWAHPGGFHYRFEVCGDAGMVEFDSRRSQPLSVVARQGAGQGPGVVVPESPLAGKEPYLRELLDFLAYIRSESVPRVTPEDAVAAVAVSLAAIKSADTGEVVTL
ncbi:MAG: Gfo/Idh/MocA family oxidoreductase [Bacillota bacterium]